MTKRLPEFLKMLLLALVIGSPVAAQETLPPYHWAEEYVDYLKVRGFLPELSVSERPYRRAAIAKNLLLVDMLTFAGDQHEKNMIRLLYREFSPEMLRLSNRNEEKWRPLLERALKLLHLELLPETNNPRIKAGAFGEAGLNDGGESDENDFTAAAHSQLGLFWGNRFTLYNHMRVFKDPPDDYIGKTFGGAAAFTEQSYLAYKGDILEAKIGRDYLQLGPGRGAQLLFSDNSRAFDMYYFRIGNRFLNFSAWGIELDRRRIPAADSVNAALARNSNRFLNGHRFSVQLKDRWFLGFNEVIVYGGPNRRWELPFVNPFQLYYAASVNLEDVKLAGNIFYSIDWDLYLRDDLEIYGEFMLDDYQVESEQSSDLEPAEFGLLAGVNWTNVAGFTRSKLNVEYSQVRNRTYNILRSDWEKYLHRNEEIGHYLGNNFERFEASFDYWARSDLKLTLHGAYTRQGEGTVDGPFNTDYLAFAVEDGYSEPFPFGVVEKWSDLGFSIFYKPHSAGHISFDLVNTSIDNTGHISGESQSDLRIGINLWLQWQRFWGL